MHAWILHIVCLWYINVSYTSTCMNECYIWYVYDTYMYHIQAHACMNVTYRMFMIHKCIIYKHMHAWMLHIVCLWYIHVSYTSTCMHECFLLACNVFYLGHRGASSCKVREHVTRFYHKNMRYTTTWVHECCLLACNIFYVSHRGASSCNVTAQECINKNVLCMYKYIDVCMCVIIWSRWGKRCFVHYKSTRMYHVEIQLIQTPTQRLKEHI
jgi:hypothetical protein